MLQLSSNAADAIKTATDIQLHAQPHATMTDNINYTLWADFSNDVVLNTLQSVEQLEDVLPQ